MRDNLRQYRAIRETLAQWYPGAAKGRITRHVNTSAALISGIVASKSTQLPKIATTVPDRTKAESRIKRFSRWLHNALITEEVYFLPDAEVLLAQLALQTLVLVLDGRVVGRGCVALRMHVIYKGRARPVAWQVRQGKKGHFPEPLHIALVKQLQGRLPEASSVVLLGEGECDGIGLQQTLQEAGWAYGCRTGVHLTASWKGETFRLDTLGAWIKPGTLVDLPEVLFTAEAYGPIRLICCWACGYQDPLYLVPHMASAEEACRLYEKRFRIEPFFSDQKSRGFHLHKSHLSDPKRLSRLLIAACLAYIWIIYLGSIGLQEPWVGIIHRRHRGDLSLFQLGLRLLGHFLHEDLPMPVSFHLGM